MGGQGRPIVITAEDLIPRPIGNMFIQFVGSIGNESGLSTKVYSLSLSLFFFRRDKHPY